jgi:hypothetical protein
MIQVDDEVREMTDEEHNFYLQLWEEARKHGPLPITDSPSS